jgi:hypothetical protein
MIINQDRECQRLNALMLYPWICPTIFHTRGKGVGKINLFDQINIKENGMGTIEDNPDTDNNGVRVELDVNAWMVVSQS